VFFCFPFLGFFASNRRKRQGLGQRNFFCSNKFFKQWFPRGFKQGRVKKISTLLQKSFYLLRNKGLLFFLHKWEVLLFIEGAFI